MCFLFLCSLAPANGFGGSKPRICELLILNWCNQAIPIFRHILWIFIFLNGKFLMGIDKFPPPFIVPQYFCYCCLPCIVSRKTDCSTSTWSIFGCQGISLPGFWSHLFLFIPQYMIENLSTKSLKYEPTKCFNQLLITTL